MEHVQVKSPTCGVYPSQEGTSSQGGPPAWVLDMQASLMEFKQQQAEIIQNQRWQKEYMDRLGDTYHELSQQVNRLGDIYEDQGQRIERIGNLIDFGR